MTLRNLARMTSATSGTGTLTLGSAVSGFLTFALAGVVDGEIVPYSIRDGANSEVGLGTYTASGTTLARTTILASTNSGAAISCSGSQEVLIPVLSENLTGRRELIAQVTPTGAGTVIVSSTIPAYYSSLLIEFAIASTQATNTVTANLLFNNDTTTGNYRYQLIEYNPFGLTQSSGGSYIIAYLDVPGTSAPANSFCIGTISIPQYANTNMNKIANHQEAGRYDSSSVHLIQAMGSMHWSNTAAITRVDMSLSAGNFASNSVIRLYGVF